MAQALGNPSDVWRKVDGKAIRCTECDNDDIDILYSNGNPVGVEHHCIAEDGVCVFLKKKIDGQEWWSDFHDLYKEDAGNEP